MSLQLQINIRMNGFTLNAAFQAEQSPIGLLGPSGSGKSLSLKAIAGIVTPDDGRIVLNDRVLFDSDQHINLPPQKRRVGYLFQNGALFPHMTVAQNIACGIRMECNKHSRQEAVMQMIQAMRLTGLERRKPAELSGGERQRAALGRILIGKPELLLLDEPFTGLDGRLKDDLMEELHSTLERFDRQVLLVTHSPGEAYALCKSTALIAEGRIICTGDTEAVFQNQDALVKAKYAGCKSMADAVKLDERHVFIPAWNQLLTIEPPNKEQP